MLVVIGIIIVSGLLVTLALCRAAGEADRWMEEIFKKQEK